MADPYFANVTLLMHLDGANGSTTFTDVKGHSFTASGAAVLTTAQFKFGTASLDSVGTNINSPNSTDWQLGAGQFTVECWVRPTSALSGVRTLISFWSTTPHFSWQLGFNGNTLNWFYSTLGTDSPSMGAAYTPTLNSWVHIAADRDTSHVIRVYANGAVIASSTIASTFFADSIALLEIGNDGTNGRRFAGQIDEVRITKGIARYGGAFTAPTAPFDDTGPIGGTECAVSVSVS